jgi:hypothetical protein
MGQWSGDRRQSWDLLGGLLVGIGELTEMAPPGIDRIVPPEGAERASASESGSCLGSCCGHPLDSLAVMEAEAEAYRAA